MNNSLSINELTESTLSDGIWSWESVKLPEKGRPLFEADDRYSYVVNLTPRSDLRGLLFSRLVRPTRRQRVVEGKMEEGWIKLFSHLQRWGHDISIAIVKKKRCDTWRDFNLEVWEEGKNRTLSYYLSLTAKVDDPAKFADFLSQEGNGTKLQKIILHQIHKHLHQMLDKGEDIRKRVADNFPHHSILEDAGYHISRFTLNYTSETIPETKQ